MGLLSSRTFRQIALGAAGRYEEKRQTMRDRIDEYRERALTQKEKIQEKYNEFYDEEKQNVNNFKFVATKVGQSYLPQLNSFATAGGDLVSLNNMGIDDIRRTLDNYKPIEDSYVGGSKERLKLKSNELNQNLQDQVGLFKGTSTLFTRDLEERGMKDIQATVGTIDTGKPIDTRVSVGEGMRSGTFVGQSKISANIDYFYNTLQTPKVDDVDRPVLDADGSQVYTVAAGQQDTINMINQQAQTLIENGFEGSLDQARGNVIEKMNNQDYNLSLLTTATENSPISVAMQNAYQQAKQAGNTKDMQDAIDELRDRNLVAIADRLQQDLDDFTTETTDEPEVQTETTTTTTQPTDDIPGLKVEGAGSRAKTVPEDYLTDADKDANSKKQVSEELIKQVMDKNNVDRNRAIEIMQMYGYTQFPDKPKKETQAPPFLKGRT